jgi:threonyl-tRNA synthetase
MNIKITFPDGSIKEIDSGKTAQDIIKEEIGEGLLNASIAVKINDEIKDLTTPITNDCNFKVITTKDSEAKEVLHHSSAHILALAILRLHPNVKLTIGPAIENGFYYDIDMDVSITEEDFEKIEQEAKKIISEKIPFIRNEVSYNEAKEMFKDNPYKLEMIEELEKEKITIYSLNDFKDLCRGPHLKHTGKVKSFKITKTSGAYWKGDSKNKQLTRVYGTSFFTNEEMKEYLIKQEEISKRDHRKIGRELDLYSFHQEAPGIPFFHDKGSFIWNKLVDFVSIIMEERNYEINKTPIILNKSLWLQSGHWDHYKENMYFTKIDNQDFAVKPMNCPGNILIYKANQYSYRDLPIRAGEFGLVHRHELSGVLSGLFRVRSFTQDDAHVFCTEEQLKEEIKDLIDFMDVVYKTFNFSYTMELSTKPEKAMGDPKKWEMAENTLQEVLDEMKKEYKINAGDGAFYGPKIDFHLTDAIGRKWQCGTIQLDFQMPEKFDLTYEADDNTKKRPIMLHRAVLGSVERFMGILVEHFKGKFPLWISPLQVIILPIADRHNKYAREIKEKLKKEGFRVSINDKAETMNKKIRSAQLEKINYILVIGDKEEENQTINVRTRDEKILGEMKLSNLIEQMKQETLSKEIK